MAFKNRIRLPIQLHSPQFPEERNVFRKANGESMTLSAIIRKSYELETDWMPEHWHQRFKIALSHDEVTIEATNHLGDIVQDGDYNIDWQDTPLRYPTAKAGVKVQVTPFDATNNNCQTCAEATQVDLEDDFITGIYGNLQEDSDYTWPLADNDNICCYPAVFSLVSFNTDYLTSASIDPTTGELDIHTGVDLTSVNNVLLATYRVTCPNGGYDEANVYANVDGSVEGCLAPTNVVVSATTTTSLSFSWDPPEPPSDSYLWELYLGDSPVGSPVASGSPEDPASGEITGLDPNTEYYFQVKSICVGGESNYVSTTGTTAMESTNCGQYRLTYTPPGLSGITSVNYINCVPESAVAFIVANGSTLICALENSAGDPVSIETGSPHISITYLGPC